MLASLQALKLIAAFEGFSAMPYRCPAGLLTIGYGHVIRAGEDFKLLDVVQARRLLAADVTAAEWAVQKLIAVPLAQHQFDALVSFTFNLGSGALERSTLRRVVNRGEQDQVERQLMRWVFAGGKRRAGLVRRRAAESRLYNGIIELF